MWRFIRVSRHLLSLMVLLASAASAQPPREQIELANHRQYSGLIESEDADWLTLIRIEVPPGRPMHLVIQPFDRRQIVAVTRLDDQERAALQKEIEDFRNRATIEAVRMGAIRLTPSQGEGCKYSHYQSKWLSLDSTADEQSTRRVIVRTEQIFAAYRQILPPRAAPQRPLRMIVLSSMSEYQPVLLKLGVKTGLQNPACYLEEKNTVVIGSELARLESVDAQLIAQNARLRQELKDLDARLTERLRAVGDSLRQSGLSNGDIGRELTKERSAFQQQRDKKIEQLRQSDLKIDHLFKQSAGQMLVRLYHEAFHAYVRNWVFQRPRYEIPAWLDEGLAVLFENGLLEGDTLRVDAPNPAALKKLKADMAGLNPLALSDLLAARRGDFHIASGQLDAADRYYVNAWGMAYYLTFEKNLLSSPTLETYLRSDSARLAPGERFRLLTGMPPEQFDEQWRAYIGELKTASAGKN